MQTLDSLSQVSIDTVYSQEYIHDLKNKLEIKQGGELQIQQTAGQLSIECTHYSSQKCEFLYLFAKKIDVQTHEMGYELKQINQTHTPSCKINDEQYSFEKNFDMIQNAKGSISNLILTRYQSYGPQNPKKILDLISQSWGYDESFIYKGLRCRGLKRKIKKKFDNLVAQVRRFNNLKTTKLKMTKKMTKRRKASFRIYKHSCLSAENEAIQLSENQIFNSDSDIDDDSSSLFAPEALERKQKLKNKSLKSAKIKKCNARFEKKSKQSKQEGNAVRLSIKQEDYCQNQKCCQSWGVKQEWNSTQLIDNHEKPACTNEKTLIKRKQTRQ